MSHILIIGAGISGLLAATELQQAGHNVTVIDKGRQVGGRMSTRQLSESAAADHGAQFFTVRSERFGHWVNAWIEARVVAEWTRGFGRRDGHPRYRGEGGMTAVCQHLAQNLPVHVKTCVESVEIQDGRWKLTVDSGDIFWGNGLIITTPVPQSMALLDSGQIDIGTDLRNALEAVKYDPCFAVMARLSAASLLPDPGAIQVMAEPIDWIADNHQKGISAEPTVTIHAAAGFTRHHFEADREAVGNMLLDFAAKSGWLERAAVIDFQVHRWKYAKPTVLHPERCLTATLPLPIAFAGDAFFEPRVEGAALSGLAAADWLCTLDF